LFILNQELFNLIKILHEDEFINDSSFLVKGEPIQTNNDFITIGGFNNKCS